MNTRGTRGEAWGEVPFLFSCIECISRSRNACSILEAAVAWERGKMNGLDVDDDADLWHPSGWSPVYDGVSSVRHLVGFTTLQVRVDVFRMSRPAGHKDFPDAFVFSGKAKRILRGDFYGWVVESGDWRDMPDFWLL